MMLTRRTALASGALLATSIAAPAIVRAAEAEFVYKYGIEVPGTHPTGKWVRQAAERIKLETGGRLEIQVFTDSQLGSSTDMISQLRSGALEFGSQYGATLSTLVPATAIEGVGFAFRSEEQVWPALDGELGAYIRRQIEKANLVVMDKIWGHGFRHMTSSVGPISFPADLQRLKIRVPAGPIFVSLFKALSASTMTINFNETYSALQTHVADAEENPLAVVIAAKLYEVQKYLSLTRHMWGGYWFLANKDAFAALPADIRATVARVANECAVEQRVELAALDLSIQQQIAAKGIVINNVDNSPFRDALTRSGYYREWQAKFGSQAWGLLERYAGKLA